MYDNDNKASIINQWRDLCAKYPRVITIAREIDARGGRVLLVGGAVRDMALHIPVKDLDIEVHGITLEQLEKILSSHGPVSQVGKSFGVIRLHGLDVDWSLPRADQPGRKPYVTIDPNMDMQRACMRRDLTINAMAVDVLTGELIDPCGGMRDLADGILRATDPKKFEEDPLRFFRVMQFIGRFGMQPDDQLNRLCSHMQVSTVSRERIESEFNKLMLKSKRPSLGIRWLDSIGRLQEILPELAATKQVIQDLKWHPEGNVFEHTMQAIDAAAQLKYAHDSEKLIIMYAALCHDLGKITHTQQIDGRIRSLGHAQAGVSFAKRLLKRITNNKDLIAAVTVLVRHHMDPFQLIANQAKPAAYKRLANKLAPHATLAMLSALVLADKRGRNPDSHEPLTAIPKQLTLFLEQAQKLNILHETEKPLLQGKDLLDVMQPGPQMGQMLKEAYELQLERNIQDKQELKRLILEKNSFEK